jgi:predicted phosphodiesterase
MGRTTTSRDYHAVNTRKHTDLMPPPDAAPRSGIRLVLFWAGVMLLCAHAMGLDEASAQEPAAGELETKARPEGRPALADTALIRTTLPAGLPRPWTHLDVQDPDGAFHFAVIADLTGGYRNGMFPAAVEKIKRLHPAFVMSVGDLIEGYTDNTAQVQRWWDQFDRWIAGLEAPFFYVPGNHDVSNPTLRALWRSRLGPLHYHFVYKDVLFLVLNTEDTATSDAAASQGALSKTQVDAVRSALEKYSDVRWTLVFMHRPVWRDEDPSFAAVEQLLAGRRYTVFAGHTHQYRKATRRGQPYYVLATTGGGSRLAGPRFGMLDHIAWITMTGDGPTVANLSLDGILADDLVTEADVRERRAFLESTALTHTPILAYESTPHTAETEVSVRNATAMPLKLEARFTYNSNIVPDRDRIRIRVPPRDTNAIPLRLTIDSTAAVEDLGPLELQYRIASAAETLDTSATALAYDGTHAIRVERVRAVPRIQDAIRVDGALDEWTGGKALTTKPPAQLGYYAETWTGLDDSALAAAAAHDGTHLYIAVRVRDDDRVLTSHRAPWEEDGLTVHLQGDLPDASLRFHVSPDMAGANGRVHLPERASQVVVTRHPDGFQVEAALPLASVSADRPVRGQELRLQLILYDHDGTEDQYKGTKYYWQGEGPGAGTIRLR